MLGMVSFKHAIAILSLRQIFRYSTSKNVVTFKSGSEVTKGHWKWYHSIDLVWFAITILYFGDAEKARTEKARTENAAPSGRGGNGENGKVGK